MLTSPLPPSPSPSPSHFPSGVVFIQSRRTWEGGHILLLPPHPQTLLRLLPDLLLLLLILLQLPLAVDPPQSCCRIPLTDRLKVLLHLLPLLLRLLLP